MRRFSGMAFLAGAFFLAGTSVVTARFLSGKLGVFAVSAASLFFALAALLPFRIVNIIRTLRQYGPKDWLCMLFQALTGIVLFRMFLLLGLERTGTLEAGILTGATPAITVLLARIVLKEALGGFRLAGLACTCAGVILLQADFGKAAVFNWEHLAGNALIFCAAFCESVFNVFSRRESLRRRGNTAQSLNPLDRTACVTGIAFMLCLPPALLDPASQGLFQPEGAVWLALIWYGVAVTALAFVFFYAGIQRCEAGTAAAFSGLMPLSTFLLSVFLLKENAGLMQCLGGLLVVSGILIISVREGNGAKLQDAQKTKCDLAACD